MKFLSLALVLLGTANAVKLASQVTDEDKDILVEGAAPMDYYAPPAYKSNSYSQPPAYKHHDYSDCSDDDDEYFCPPALEKCPGVLQPPGPCKTALCARPLCYSNEGYMHTDWNHEVKVADECKYEKEDYKPEYKPEYKAPTYDKKY